MPGSILLKPFWLHHLFPFEISHLGVSDIKNIPIPKINAGNTPNKSINLHPRIEYLQNPAFTRYENKIPMVIAS